MGIFGGMGFSEGRWAPHQKFMGLLLAGGAPSSRASGVYFETIGPMGIGRAHIMIKKPYSKQGPVNRANKPL